ncbi:MAG: hypothetical protein WD733_23170 [Bryobacterales bacterium]
MQYIMFQASGTPVRATIVVQNWVLDCRFQPGPARPRPHLAAHELVHVVQQGVTVRGWDIAKKDAIIGPRPARPGVRVAGATRQLLPEVDDEVLVSFECATPRAAAIIFNPKEFSLAKSAPWQADRGDVGMIRQGNYTIVVQRRNAIQPLQLALALAPDATMRHNVQMFPIG